jgi:hypothetical protein
MVSLLQNPRKWSQVVFSFPFEAEFVSASGMVDTPRLQAKNVFRCREATCHSGESRNPVNTVLEIPGCRIKSGMTA